MLLSECSAKNYDIVKIFYDRPQVDLVHYYSLGDRLEISHTHLGFGECTKKKLNPTRLMEVYTKAIGDLSFFKTQLKCCFDSETKKIYALECAIAEDEYLVSRIKLILDEIPLS